MRQHDGGLADYQNVGGPRDCVRYRRQGRSRMRQPLGGADHGGTFGRIASCKDHMTDNHTALTMLEAQIRELDAIYKEAADDLNTVRSGERIAAWKKRTVPLLAQQIGQKESQQFSLTTPGPSFTHDLAEELSDEVELYRNFLTSLVKRLKTPGPG